MCGRFTLGEPEKVTKRFNVSNEMPLFKPSWNVSPGTDIPVVTKNSPNKLSLMKWGFSWSENIKNGPINIRCESFEEKSFFKNFLLKQRCLIVADSFYEWGEVNLEGKQEKYPFNFFLSGRKLFAFAGIYNNGTCAIITTTANKLVVKVHNRMPVIISQEKEEFWLNLKNIDFESLNLLLKPFDEKKMKMQIVSKRVNSPKINDPGLVKEYKM